MSDPSIAPENMPDGDWRAAFGSLRTEVASLEGEVRGLGNQVNAAVNSLDRIGAKVDAIGHAQVGMQHTTGRISAQLILGMIAVITPIVVAAAALGHVFVKSGDDNLNARIDELRTNVHGIENRTDGIIKLQTEMVRDWAETRWAKEDHLRYDQTQVLPMEERLRQSEIEIARLRESLEIARESSDSKRK